MAPPFKTAEFEIQFGKGIVKIGEIFDLATKYDIIHKSGSWFSYEDTKLGQGRENAIKLLEDNPELCEELENKIKEILKNKQE